MGKLVIVKTGATTPALLARRGDFEDWILAGLQLEAGQAVIADVRRGDALPDYAGVSGVVVTGSHDMVTDHHAWSERVARWLPGAIAWRIPLLGICYGHQLLAYALGGQVGHNPQGEEAGVVEVRLHRQAQTDALLGGLPNPIRVHVSHAQTVLRLPPGARLLASSDMDAHQAFVVGERAWGVQFHPEFDADISAAYIREDWDRLLAQGRDPARLIETCRDTPYGAAILARFADIVQTAA